MRALEPHGISAATFIDVDPRKLGRTTRGAPVVTPASTPSEVHSFFVHSNASSSVTSISSSKRSRPRLKFSATKPGPMPMSLCLPISPPPYTGLPAGSKPTMRRFGFCCFR